MYSGLVFDGHERYRNISDEADDPTLGRLTVYTNPTFDTFDGTRKYDPDDEEVLDIKVRLRAFSDFLAGSENVDFLHVFAYIMEGRTALQKQALSTAVVTR